MCFLCLCLSVMKQYHDAVVFKCVSVWRERRGGVPREDKGRITQDIVFPDYKNSLEKNLKRDVLFAYGQRSGERAVISGSSQGMEGEPWSKYKGKGKLRDLGPGGNPNSMKWHHR